MAKQPKPEEIISQINYKPPQKAWMNVSTEIKEGMFCWGAKEKSLQTVDFPNPRQWSPLDEDWKLPENWQDIVLEGIAERIKKIPLF